MKPQAYLSRAAISISVGAAVLGMSYLISNTVTENMSQTAYYYRTAQKADDKKQFDYLFKTQAGRIGVNKAEITVSDPVKEFPELKGKYSYVEKTREDYTMHTSTSTNSKGHTTTRTWWQWDYEGSDDYSSKEFFINGKRTKTKVDFPSDDLKLDDKNFDISKAGNGLFSRIGFGGDYYYKNSYTRFSYAVSPIKETATAWISVNDDGIYPLTSAYDTIATTTRSVDEVNKDYVSSIKETGSNIIIAGFFISIAAAIETIYLMIKE